MKKQISIETQLIHAGEPENRYDGAVNLPIFQSSTFEYQGSEGHHDLKYIRHNNTPNHTVLHKKIAALENGEAALVTASGMAAISTTLLTLLSSGDHLLAQNCLYGGTQSLLQDDFPSFGLSHDFINADKPETWQEKLKPNTKAIYVEALTNPLLQVADLQEIVAFAKSNNIFAIIDNTFTTPINFQPLNLGFDISLHSATKYLNGHSDIVAGAVIGSKNLIDKIKHRLNHLGGALDPHACFLLHRGLKTLSVRVHYQNESTLKIAEFLEKHPSVNKVNYPFLKSHPYYDRAKTFFKGCSGVLSLELKGGAKAAEEFIKKVTIPIEAPSLGGTETLITRPATTSHSGLTKAEREKIGIHDSLVRISVGLEGTDDLIADFDQALTKI